MDLCERVASCRGRLKVIATPEVCAFLGHVAESAFIGMMEQSPPVC